MAGTSCGPRKTCTEEATISFEHLRPDLREKAKACNGIASPLSCPLDVSYPLMYAFNLFRKRGQLFMRKFGEMLELVDEMGDALVAAG